MIKRLLLISTLSIVFVQFIHCTPDTIFFLSVHLKNYNGRNTDLGYTYGRKVLFKDQIKLDNEGNGVYKGIDHGGIYFLRMPDSSAFEFMLTQSGYYDIFYSNGRITIRGNPATEAYDRYSSSVNNQLRQIDSLKNIAETRETIQNKDVRMKINHCKDSIESLTKVLAEIYEGSLLGSYAKALLPVKIPPDLLSSGLRETDSSGMIETLYFYKQHFFDNIDFSDPALIYTPVIEDKISSYLDHMVKNSPDTLCKAIDKIIGLSFNPEVKEFVTTLLMQKFRLLRHHKPGEQAYIHLVQDYYLSGETPWVSDREKQLLTEEIKKMQPVLDGTVAPEIELSDATGRSCSLQAVQSELTILIFWDFSCANCRRIMQDFINLIKKYYYMDIQVYSVYTGTDLDIWKAWNYKKLPGTWINTYQKPDNPVSSYFNIEYIPAIFILDTNKVILKKNITVSELDSYLFQHAEY